MPSFAHVLQGALIILFSLLGFRDNMVHLPFLIHIYLPAMTSLFER